MPAPLEDINRDHQCYFYQAPSGQRCGSPALKGEYYCYHHHIKHAKRNQGRVLIDPEVTCMEIPPIEDRATIFIALAAVIHRLAENTIDTRRAGQMIYGLQVAMRALDPPPAQRSAANNNRHFERAQRVEEPQGTAPATTAEATPPPDPPTPQTVPISKEGLLYFLRSRHCAHCNAELFPANELTHRRNAGAPPEVIEESHQALTDADLPALLLQGPAALTEAKSIDAEDEPKNLPAPGAPFMTVSPSWVGSACPHTSQPSPSDSTPQSVLPTINAVASTLGPGTHPRTSNREPRTAPGAPFMTVSPSWVGPACPHTSQPSPADSTPDAVLPTLNAAAFFQPRTRPRTSNLVPRT